MPKKPATKPPTYNPVDLTEKFNFAESIRFGLAVFKHKDKIRAQFCIMPTGACRVVCDIPKDVFETLSSQTQEGPNG